MASGPYIFPAIPVRGCGKLVMGYVSVELAKQSIARIGTGTDEVPSYGAVDYASPTSVTERVFLDIPEIAVAAEPEIGAFGADGVRFQCLNAEFDTGVRMTNILFDDNPLYAVWHVRVKYITAEDYNAVPQGPWSTLFQGVIDHEDADVRMADRDDPDSWIVEFSATDAIMQLEDSASNLDFFNAYLPHATYSFAPVNGVVISWLENSAPHAHALTRFDVLLYDGRWAGFIDPSTLKFLMLHDFLQALSNSIGITAPANNGAAPAHTWEFIAYNGTADQTFTWDDLCIPSGIKTNLSPWYQDHGYFDAEGRSSISFYNAGSALEILKSILIPFGMSAHTGVNTAGARCLYYGEFQDYTSNALPAWYSPAALRPAARSLYGIAVNVPETGDVVIGTHGDGGTAIRSPFLTANRIPNCFQWRHDPAGAEPGRCDDYGALLRSLYAYDSSADKVYSIYKINVRTDGYTGTAGYAQDLSAEYNAEGAGLLLARATAAYYYCPYLPATGAYRSEVGLYRRRMQRVEFTAPGILAAGYAIGQYITWDGRKWWIYEKTYDLRAGITRLVCETGE